MSVIVCNDERSHDGIAEFPWDRIESFNNRLNTAIGSHKVGPFDRAYPDPFVKYRYFRVERGNSPELEEDYSDLMKAVDEDREARNVDGLLCKELRVRNFSVRLFDGWRVNANSRLWFQEADPNRSAAELCQLIVEGAAGSLVYDLEYFKGSGYGRSMLFGVIDQLGRLRSGKAVPFGPKLHVIVYSKFLHDEGNMPDQLKERFSHAVNFDFVDRLGGGGNKIPIIAELLRGRTPRD